MELDSDQSDTASWPDVDDSPVIDDIVFAGVNFTGDLTDSCAPPPPMAEAAHAGGSQASLPAADGDVPATPCTTAADDIPESLRNPERDPEAPRVEGDALPTIEAEAQTDQWARRGFELLQEIQRANPPHDPSALHQTTDPSIYSSGRGLTGEVGAILDPSAAPASEEAALMLSAIPTLFGAAPGGGESGSAEA